jgi:hypothetical protein
VIKLEWIKSDKHKGMKVEYIYTPFGKIRFSRRLSAWHRTKYKKPRPHKVPRKVNALDDYGRPYKKIVGWVETRATNTTQKQKPDCRGKYIVTLPVKNEAKEGHAYFIGDNPELVKKLALNRYRFILKEAYKQMEGGD